MLDTVVLTLPNGSFAVMDKERFTPNIALLAEDPVKLLGNQAFMKFTCNPTKKDLLSGKYYPRLTLVLRKAYPGVAKTLRVEFSVPKLLYGNNFDELSDKDFEPAVEALKERLKEMGVLVFKQNLKKAPVSGWHFSKNIPMQDYTSCSMVLNELAKANVFNRLDLNERDFRNGGQAIKFHASAFEITFYDKLKDLEKARTSEKRAIENDNKLQQSLFDLTTLNPKYQVLRMEVRLNTKKKISAVLKSVGLEWELAFVDLFSWQLSQAVLQHFWEPIRGALRVPSLDEKVTPIELFEVIKKANPLVPLAKLLRLHSAIVCIKSGSSRRYRVALGFVGSRSSRWSVLMRDMNALNLPDHYRSSEKITDGLDKFNRNITVADKCKYNKEGGL